MRGPPPQDRARWGVRLIASEAAKRKLAPQGGRETVRILFEGHELKPRREIKWRLAERNKEYIARMEDVLALYERPLSDCQPVNCMNEKPVMLRADVRPPRPMRPGGNARRDGEHRRRLTKPTPSRSSPPFADSLPEIVARYPEADAIPQGLDHS